MAKYTEQEADGIRKSLFPLIEGILNENEDEDYIRFKECTLDITGSMACWGIAQ